MEPNVISDDFEGSQDYSPSVKSQHHLMHNLNKGGGKYLGQQDE